MAYEKILSLDVDEVFDLTGKKDKKTGQSNPKTLEGYYLGNRVTTGGRYGDSVVHVFQTSSGNKGAWGKTDLNTKLGSVRPGTMTLVEYSGTKPTKNGEMHVFAVSQDRANTIDVGGLESASTDLLGDSDGYDDSDTDDEDYEAPKATVAAKSSAQRKAEVEALLKRKN